jgi:hypothetical protein
MFHRSSARLAITSFAFMLVDVPAPPGRHGLEFAVELAVDQLLTALSMPTRSRSWSIHSKLARAAAIFTIPDPVEIGVVCEVNAGDVKILRAGGLHP